MSEYYAVQRSGEFLEHYGVRGMKWGVRKAISRGSDRALGRQYKKAAKKLAKLEKRGANGAKYAKRAAAYGAGAALAGGAAALGTSGVSRIMRGAGSVGAKASRAFGGAMSKAGAAAGKLAVSGAVRNGKIRTALGKTGTALTGAGKAVTGASSGITRGARQAATAVSRWGNQKALGDGAKRAIVNAAGTAMSKSNRNLKTHFTVGQLGNIQKGVNNLTKGTAARIGAGVLGAGLGIAAGRNAYRAATAKRNQAKAAQFRSEMNKAFAGTKYANGATNRQGKKRKRT